MADTQITSAETVDRYGASVKQSARVRTKVMKVAAYAVIAAGLLLLGGLLGHRLTPPTVVAGPSIEVSGSFELTEFDPDVVEDLTVMPDVIGLDEETARRVLRDAALGAEVGSTDREVAGAPGLIVEQSPPPGDEVAGPLSWVVSTPAVMPDLTGQTTQEASSALTELGASVQLSRVVAPTETPGRILETEPPAGEDVPESVTLVVSEPGDALFLTDLDSVDRDGSCSRHERTATVDGIPVERSIRCEVSAESPAMLEYNIARHAEALRAVIGIDDAGEQGTGQVQVLLDGTQIALVDVASGSSEEVLVPVSGGLRLRFELTSESADDRLGLILGDATVLAKQTDLDLLRSL